jgi:hypothetical protein
MVQNRFECAAIGLELKRFILIPERGMKAAKSLLPRHALNLSIYK